MAREGNEDGKRGMIILLGNSERLGKNTELKTGTGRGSSGSRVG